MSFKILKSTLKLKKTDLRQITLLTHIAKNIYNSSLYLLRQEYFKTGKILSYQKIKENLIGNPNFRMLEPYQAAVIINKAREAMSMYNKYHYSNGNIRNEYINDVAANSYKFPGYKAKSACFTITTVNATRKNIKNKEYFVWPLSYRMNSKYALKNKYNDELLDNFIKKSHLDTFGELKIKIPRRLYGMKINYVSIVPKENSKIFEVHYNYLEPEFKIENNNTEALAIDLGVSNLATCVTTTNKSFIIDGKKLKSIIRLYNKQIAKAKAKLPLNPMTNRPFQTSKRIGRLFNRLNHHLDNYIGNAIKKLYTEAKRYNVKRIIVGWNYGLKNGGIKPKEKMTNKIKKQKNQSFLQMPIAKFKDKLMQKAKYYGMEVSIINEAYTSKASFYDNDPLEGTNFAGTRIMRGLYKRNDGKIVNADLNAALNIYRKYVKKCSSSEEKLNFLMSSGIPVPNRIRVI